MQRKQPVFFYCFIFILQNQMPGFALLAMVLLALSQWNLGFALTALRRPDLMKMFCRSGSHCSSADRAAVPEELGEPGLELNPWYSRARTG